MQKTKNYGFGKPNDEDFYNVNVFNENVDAIDEELKKHANHVNDTENPHNVTPKQLGLENVDNTKDEDKSVKHATTADSATEAKRDINGNDIIETYATKEECNTQGVADTASGNNPTASNSTDGNLIYLKNSGYTEQKTLSGKNLCDLSKATDGYMVTWNTGNLYASASHFVTDYIEVEPSTTYTIQGFSSGSENWYYDENKNPIKGISSATFTTPSNCGYIRLTGTLSTKGTQQVELGEVATDFEEFCGGIASPNPEYPQYINGLADKGYFDGQLVLNSDVLENAISNKNPFTCKAGDVIKVIYEDVVDNFSMRLIDTDGQAWSYNLSNVNEMEWAAPKDAQEVYFYIKNDTISSVADAKHITVTINGMCALRVKTHGKNVLKPTLETITQNEITCTNNGDGTYTLNGTATLDCYFNVGKIKVVPSQRYLVSGCPSGGHWNTYFFAIVGMGVDAYDIGNGGAWSTGEKTGDKLVTIGVKKGTTLSNLTFKPMVRLDGMGDNTFEPYQETEALIPVSAPFYDGDYIEVYADGSGQIVRENKVFKNPTLTNSDGLWYWFVGGGILKKSADCLCDKLNKTDNKLTTDGYGNVTFRLKEGQSIDDLATSVFVCKLATPTSTPLTAEQVAEFLKLRTYKTTTYINAEGEVVMRYYCDNASGETVSMLQEMASNSGSGGVTELFKTITVTETTTLPSKQITSVSIPIDVPSGYSIFGIKSIYNNTLTLLYGFSCSDDSVSVSVKNTSELELQGSVSVSVSCVKTSAIS